MIIRSLNIRGSGSKLKQNKISQVISMGNADLFLIQETKLEFINDRIAGSF